MEPQELISHAVIAQNRAAATYSNYPVGAALLTEEGEIILGCNVESKAYPTTLCAERVAIFSAIAQGYVQFKAMALVTKDGAYPCGSCRQIIHEYTGNIPLYIADGNNGFSTCTVSKLLPYPFG
ncbi:MAG: cytidine deaminase [Candidatus Marinimicrobia bacterium]|jgi:cytidine deaminase|nr:cytidine deaminase [Candidatus Neomarinimicrobiota bacterium]MDP6853274.1 cytidine deaminase [Candidatus Neomarinimicrobiota bacterium]MDP6936221.1 cytidine deaminase [Candidatus Neomarinimicrobiota bacterium]